MTYYNTFRDQLAIAHPAFGWESDPGQQYLLLKLVTSIVFAKEHFTTYSTLFSRKTTNPINDSVYQSDMNLFCSAFRIILTMAHGTLNPNNFCSYGVTV